MYAALLIALLTFIDQLTKYWAVTYLRLSGSVPIIKGIFHLTYVENTGAAFGILAGKRWLFVVFTIAILCGMFLYYRSLPRRTPFIALRRLLLVVAAGALGNFIDRLFFGYVVDFLHFTFVDFPVFNLADCYISIGSALICFMLLFMDENPDEDEVILADCNAPGDIDNAETIPPQPEEPEALK